MIYIHYLGYKLILWYRCSRSHVMTSKIIVLLKTGKNFEVCSFSRPKTRLVKGLYYLECHSNVLLFLLCIHPWLNITNLRQVWFFWLSWSPSLEFMMPGLSLFGKEKKNITCNLLYSLFCMYEYPHNYILFWYFVFVTLWCTNDVRATNEFSI